MKHLLGNSTTIQINPRLLLAIYGVVPIGLFVIVIDWLLLDGAIKTTGPRDPHEYLWFTILFTLPHILASFFGFFDPDYVSAYGARLLKGARYIAVAVIGLTLISIQATFLVFALYTMTHVFLQQSGIAKSLMRGANRWHSLWQWLGVLISFALYINIYADFIRVDQRLFFIGFSIATAVFVGLALQAARASTTRLGSWYFWGTVSVPIAGGVFLYYDYPLLIIAIPRIIHDLTAYVFYMAHDHNRFAQSQSNYIYRFLQKLGLPVVLASPLLSLALAYPFQAGGLGVAIYPILMSITFLHYYVEGFMWRRGSLHRRHIHYTTAIDLL